MADAATSTLRRLAELKLTRGKILSVYLDLDPSQFATRASRRTELESLLDEASRRYLSSGLTHAEAESLRADIDRVRRFFEDHFDAKGAQSVAIFCSTGADIFEVHKIPRRTGSRVLFADAPFVEPMVGAFPADDWCILVVNRRIARILRGGTERLTELGEVTDVIPRRHDQGGWAQARMQRHADGAAEEHVKHACDVVFAEFKRRPFDRFAVGTLDELWPEVDAKLHPYLKERLAGRVDIDVEHTSPDDVLRSAKALMESVERNHEREVLDRLEAALGTGNRAAAGIERVLDSLNARRVDVLVVAPGYRVPGVVCRACGWAGVSGATCPLDGEPLDRCDDVVETAFELALGQAAEVLMLRYHDSAADYRIAALRRF